MALAANSDVPVFKVSRPLSKRRRQLTIFSECAGVGKRNAISVAKSGVSEALSNSTLNQPRSIQLDLYNLLQTMLSSLSILLDGCIPVLLGSQPLEFMPRT